MSDFEQAIWLAVRRTFNGQVKMVGCYFYWSQALWRKLVDLGLGPAYRRKGSETRKICRRLMCLPFLPHGKIVRIFHQLKRSAVGKVTRLCEYIFRVWISPLTATSPPKTWSVFMKVVRTKGWHNRLNRKIRVAHPNFYKLVKSLYFYESRLVPLHVVLVCQGTLSRRQRITYSKLQDKFFLIGMILKTNVLEPTNC